MREIILNILKKYKRLIIIKDIILQIDNKFIK